MATVTLFQGFDTNDFWAARDGAALLTNPDDYRFLNVAGYYVQVIGSGFVYSGDDPAAGSGNYTQINIYSDPAFSVVVGKLSGANVAFDNFFTGAGPLALAFADFVGGGAEADILRAEAGNDVIFGNEGNDILLGGEGSDVLNGGAGDDIIDGGGPTGFDEVRYDLEPDADPLDPTGVTVNLTTGLATDRFGNTDTLIGIELMQGTADNDTLTGDTAVFNGYSGLAGDDIIIGGGGILDEVRYDRDEANGGASGVTVDLGAGTATDGFGDTDTLTGINAVRGTRFADTLTGSDGYNEFRALAGDDTIDGGDGVDTVRYDSDQFAGGTGAIEVDLAAGTATDGFGDHDTLINIENARGSLKADTLRGDGGTNELKGMQGNDILDGRGGSDWVSYRSDVFAAPISHGADVDLQAGTATDSFGDTDTLISIENAEGGHLADTLRGTAGANVLRGPAGDDIIDGRGGIDTVDYSQDATADGALPNAGVVIPDGTNGVIVDLAVGTATDGYGDHDTLTSIENVIGSAFGDTITGDAVSNTIHAGDGDDIVDGGEGSDFIHGGGGADQLSGGGGKDFFFDDDHLDGDLYSGGEGYDRVTYSGGGAYDFSAPGADTFDASVENVIFNDTVTVTGTTGNDTFTAYGAGSTLDGGDGDDILVGTTGDETLLGGAGNDRLYAGTGSDFIRGGQGSDNMSGGIVGLTGDGETDTFFYTLSDINTIDRIRDFEAGIDKFGLDAESFGLAPGALDASRFYQFGETVTETGPVFIYNGATGTLYFDPNGSEAGGFTAMAYLTGNPELTADDFLVI